MAVTEAALFEPVINGSSSSVDEMLTRFADALGDAYPDPETWGHDAASQAGLAAFGEPAVMPVPEESVETELTED